MAGEDRYSAVKPRFWTGPTGRRIRRDGGSSAVLVAVYLMTGPDTVSTGLFVTTPPTIGHYTGLKLEEVLEALERLARLKFAYYDAEAEVVWVVEMLRHQYGDKLKAEDARRKGLVKLLDRFVDSRFYQAFLWRYGSSHLPPDYVSERRRARDNEEELERGVEEGGDVLEELLAELFAIPGADDQEVAH